jgi:hypothetical protein
MSDVADAEIAGEFRSPVNQAANSKGSIHDDATASKLGFRGGTVAGSVHMDQYVPLLLQAFGDDWLSRGNLSCYFKQATIDREAVRAFVRRADAAHGRVRMENEAGDLINEGTASAAGPDTESELSRRVKGMAPALDLRILASSRVGDEVKDIPVRAARAALDRRVEAITEPMDIYKDGVLPPSVACQLMRGVENTLFSRTGVVGLFGAIELQTLAGPLLAEKDYVARGRILALTESPKTENVWYQSWVKDAATGEDAGWMIMYLRFLKGSSALWIGQA